MLLISGSHLVRDEIWSDLKETTKNRAISVQALVHLNKDPELAIRTSLKNQRMVKRGKGTKPAIARYESLVIPSNRDPKRAIIAYDTKLAENAAKLMCYISLRKFSVLVMF